MSARRLPHAPAANDKPRFDYLDWSTTPRCEISARQGYETPSNDANKEDRK